MKLGLKTIGSHIVPSRALVLAVALAACACSAQRHSATHESGPHNPPELAPRQLAVDPFTSPSGLALCYGPFREGQAPDGVQPTPAQLLEDMDIISRDFNTIRLYSSLGPEREICRVIRDHALPIHVFVGAWIAPEAHRDDQGRVIEPLPAAAEANRREVAAAVAMANDFPTVVAGVIVGNETQVFWTDHKVDPRVLIGYIREVRAQTTVPVTTADDFNFWILPESDAIAREVDYIDNHAYAMWNGTQLDEAIAFTDEKMRAVRVAHPDRLVVLGETGWATRVHTEGDQAKYIKGVPGEHEQATFYEAIRRWAAETGTIVFYFEAFDEPWKGGAHPNEVEKHWGLYNVDRSPKRALRGAE